MEPDAATSRTDLVISKPRRPWLAALLSLIGGGPLGQVYVGRARRCLVLWILGSLLFPAAAVFCSASLPIDRAGFALILLLVVAIPVYWSVDAFVIARRNRHVPLKRYQRSWVYLLTFCLFVLANNGTAWLLRSYVGEAFVVPSRAMSPTIRAGDRMLVDRLYWNRAGVRRNEVVVFYSEGRGSPKFVMRVVGLPGDEIEIRNEQVFINGKKWDDQHAVFDSSLPKYSELANHGPIKVASDCFFVLGDNRRRAKDSRVIGQIPLSDLYGKARMIYWSCERVFPDPDDTTQYTLGPIHWDRMGQRLD